jgi:hypothetical protein
MLRIVFRICVIKKLSTQLNDRLWHSVYFGWKPEHTFLCFFIFLTYHVFHHVQYSICRNTKYNLCYHVFQTKTLKSNRMLFWLLLLSSVVHNAHGRCSQPTATSVLCEGIVTTRQLKKYVFAQRNILRLTMVDLSLGCDVPLNLDIYPKLNRLVMPEKRYCRCLCGSFGGQLRGSCAGALLPCRQTTALRSTGTIRVWFLG